MRYTPMMTTENKTLDTLDALNDELIITANSLRQIADLLESGKIKNAEIHIVTEDIDDTVHYYGNGIYGPVEQGEGLLGGTFANSLEEAKLGGGYASRTIVDYDVDTPYGGRENRADASKLPVKYFSNVATAIRPVVTVLAPSAIEFTKA